MPSGVRSGRAEKLETPAFGRSLDDPPHEILSWPIGELDPFRLLWLTMQASMPSVRTTVLKVVCSTGVSRPRGCSSSANREKRVLKEPSRRVPREREGAARDAYNRYETQA